MVLIQQQENVHNVLVDIIHRQEVHLHVRNVVQHHGPKQEHLLVQHVQVVQLVLDQQVNVVVAKQDMVSIQQLKLVQYVHQENIQLEEQWFVQHVIHYVKHVQQLQENV